MSYSAVQADSSYVCIVVVYELLQENADATRIGKSDKNRKWLTNAYGVKVIEAMEDKPTICSGATMGEQIAFETYLRAMVNEFDETEIRLMGADQGFHNYLYYRYVVMYCSLLSCHGFFLFCAPCRSVSVCLDS